MILTWRESCACTDERDSCACTDVRSQADDCPENYRHRANYMLCLVIGAYFEGLGLALRLPFRNNPHSNGLYIVQYLFVVLSPCAFLAGDYILLGRIINHLGVPEYIRPFKANLISRIFIISDGTFEVHIILLVLIACFSLYIPHSSRRWRSFDR